MEAASKMAPEVILVYILGAKVIIPDTRIHQKHIWISHHGELTLHWKMFLEHQRMRIFVHPLRGFQNGGKRDRGAIYGQVKS